MKNITVSVPDDVYRTVRVKAAELDTSVSAIVTEFLRSLLTDDPQEIINRKRREEINRRLDEIIARVVPKDVPVEGSRQSKSYLSRDELYNERFDRHKRPGL